MRQPPRADATTVRCKTVQRKTKEQQSNFWLSVFAGLPNCNCCHCLEREKMPSKCETCSVPCFLFLLLTLFVNTMCAPSIVLHSACMSIACITHTHTRMYIIHCITHPVYTLWRHYRDCVQVTSRTGSPWETLPPNRQNFTELWNSSFYSKLSQIVKPVYLSKESSLLQIHNHFPNLWHNACFIKGAWYADTLFKRGAWSMLCCFKKEAWTMLHC